MNSQTPSTPLRIQKLQQTLSCDALLIEHPTNLLYLTGLELSAGKLLVFKGGCQLIVDGRYIEMAKKHSHCPVFLLDEMPLTKWLSLHSIKSLAFDTETTTYQNFLNLQILTAEQGISLLGLQDPVQKLRMIKGEDEIEVLRQAAALGYAGYEFVASRLQEGVSEAELALELEIFWKKRGAKKTAFDPIIAFGANSSMPHYRAGSTKLALGMPILIDIGVTWKHYHSDMSRVIFFGEPSPQLKEIYSIVELAKQEALMLCKPGTLMGDLDRAARQYITSRGYGQYFTHSLGHGLGLDVHEPPTLRSKGVWSDTPLQPGMVVTIEPGIYLPNLGGVRLEDTILITAQGYENLTMSSTETH